MNKIIAIPTEGELVNAHFGRSQAFTIIEIENSQIVKQERLNTANFQHQHEGIAQLLKSKGVETVICGGIGHGAIAGLANAGIEALRGASGLVVEVAQAYAAGTFVPSETVCNHGHHHGHHGHHEHHDGQHTCQGHKHE
jgi:predicted Fe-Mo cluster-binding NifX family protein